LHPIAPRSLPRLLAATAAGCLVLAACSSPATTSAPTRAPSTSPAASPAAATAVPTARASVSASPSAAANPSAAPAATWRLVDLPDAADVGQIADVVARQGSVTAAGTAGQAGEHGTAWTSTDRGATWTAESLPGPAGSIGRLVPWGERVLAVGEGQGNQDCAHPSVVEVWLRSAAGTWRAAPFDPLMCAGGMAEVAASGSHAVIVGTGAGDVPYAWSSGDGLHWTDKSAAFADRLPQGVAVDGSGFLAAGSGVDTAPAWVTHSADGRTWPMPQPITGPAGMRVMGDPVVVDGEPAIFAADPAGAVGILRPDGHGGWRSEPAQGLSSSSVSRIVSTGKGLVALGGDEHGALLWSSTDGTSWHALDLPAEVAASGTSATLTGAAVAGGRAYLTGQVLSPGGDRSMGALWTGAASLLAP